MWNLQHLRSTTVWVSLFSFSGVWGNPFGGVPGPHSGGGQVSEASVRGCCNQVPERVVWYVLHILGSDYSRLHRARRRHGVRELLRARVYVYTEMAPSVLCSFSGGLAPCRQRYSRCLRSQNWPHFRLMLLLLLSAIHLSHFLFLYLFLVAQAKLLEAGPRFSLSLSLSQVWFI